MKFKEGDKIVVRETGKTGTIKRILPNPYFPEWLSSPNYMVDIDRNEDNPHIMAKKQLKKI